VQKLASIMISYIGECHSTRDGSEIMEREMTIMEIEICVEECLLFDDVGSSSKRHYS
jgi:hypothetical protein